MTPDIKKRLQLIQCQKVPKGYFKAGNWIIPKDWKIKTGNDLFAYIRNGFVGTVTPYYVSDGVRYLQGTNIKNGKIVSNEVFFVNEDFHKKHPNSQLHLNDIVVVQSGAVGECAVVNTEYAGGNCHALIIMTPREGINVVWFSNLMNSPYRRKMLAGAITGNTIHHILASDMKKIIIPTPSIKEQNRIAEIFSLQDRIIECKESLVKEKQRQKKYLMQQLLTGRKRIKGFTDSWSYAPLRDITERIGERNLVGNDIVLTISANEGLIDQSAFFDKVVASENKENYYLLHRNDFAYNKSFSTGHPYGAIKRLTRYEAGIVSPLYICFRTKDDIISLEFLEQYFEGGLMDKEIYAFAQEGARNHGLLNISVEDFFRAKVNLPSIEEQKQIAIVLTQADKEIELLQQDVALEKQKKKALMQLLLTGIVRVKP